jgi:hypothetical protein
MKQILIIIIVWEIIKWLIGKTFDKLLNNN